MKKPYSEVAESIFVVVSRVLNDDGEMDDEFQEPISEDISSIQQPDRLSDEQRDFSEKGLTTSGL